MKLYLLRTYIVHGGISSSGDFLDLNERIVLFTSSAVVSKNTNEFDLLLLCCKGDDVVLEKHHPKDLQQSENSH